MAGLFGIISSGVQIVKQPPVMFAARFNRNDARLLKFNNAWAGLAAEPSFKDERVLETRENITIGLSGIIFEPASQRSDLFFERYKKEGLQFIQTLDGYFHGFIHDKSKKKLFLFTDYLSTRPLYYGFDKLSGTLAFSGDAHHTAALLQSAGTSLTLNTEALSCLLTIGYLFDDQTPVNQVRKIPFGTILEINLDDFTISPTRYFEFRKNPVPETLDACLEQIDHLLTRSVKKLWAKDREHGFGHTALLSGGLDSRVNVMLADKLGFRPVQTITFSQSGSSDQVIAASIARKQGYRHTFMPLDSGSYLYDNIRTYVAANDGLVAYNGAAHVYASILPLLCEKTGILHSGQIGDILFGSLTFRKVSVPEKILRKGYIYEPGITAPLDIYKRIAERYNTVNNFERYGYEQHIMNGTFNGDRMLMHHTDMLSPFYDRRLLEFCYSLPDRFKYDQAIYLKWMKRYHPEIAEFPWAKTGIRPRNALMNRTAGFLQKVNRHARKRLGLKHDNMNPFDLWYRENPKLRITLLAEYHAHEHLITDPRLREALDYCVRKDRAQYLMNAVTVVLAADLYLNG
jgi:asparagine synthase (glutamine-hydrolysing)